MEIKLINGEPDLLDPLKVDKNFCLTVNGHEADNLIKVISRGISALSFNQLSRPEADELIKIINTLNTKLNQGWNK